MDKSLINFYEKCIGDYSFIEILKMKGISDVGSDSILRARLLRIIINKMEEVLNDLEGEKE